MKREYFAMLFLLLFVLLIFLAQYIFDEAIVMDNLGKFIVIWILIAFTAGQYSMRFPKAF